MGKVQNWNQCHLHTLYWITLKAVFPKEVVVGYDYDEDLTAIQLLASVGAFGPPDYL